MWTPFFLMALVLPALATHLSDLCPYPHDVRKFADLTKDTELGAMDNIPSMSNMVADLSNADAEIKSVVNEHMLKEAGLTIRQQDTTTAIQSNDFVAFYHKNFCCPKPEYQCTSRSVRIRFIRYYGRVCYVVYSFPFKPFYTRCTCNTCVRHGYCPLIGRCVETDYRYNYLIAYCPHYYHRYVKLLIRYPTSCECLPGCNYYYPYYPYPRPNTVGGPTNVALPSSYFSGNNGQQTDTNLAIDHNGQETQAQAAPPPPAAVKGTPW